MDRALGCIIQPTVGVERISPLLASVELPKNYIVPAFRHLFDADFNVIPDEAAKFIKDQNGYPSCVGQSTAYQKEAEEGVKISGMDIYRQAKLREPDPLSYGTTLVAGQQAVIGGVCEYDLAPEGAVSLEDYVLKAPTPEQVANRELHKGTSYFRATRDEFRQTMYQFGLPLVTSLPWYMSDNDIGTNGIMPPPNGKFLGGHAICFGGWLEKYGDTDVSPNSFGTSWANNGFFFAPSKLRDRFTDALIAVDIPPNLISVLAKYDKQVVQVAGNPDIWLIANGTRHLFADEVVFFCFDYTFSQVVDISQGDLNIIPEGDAMNIDGSSPHTRELVREMRQMYGKL